MKRKYSGFTLKEAMKLIPAEVFTPWQLNVPARSPSAVLLENLRRLESFDLQTTEQGNEVYETEMYPMVNLPELLGALDYVCAECAKNVP